MNAGGELNDKLAEFSKYLKDEFLEGKRQCMLISWFGHGWKDLGLLMILET